MMHTLRRVPLVLLFAVVFASGVLCGRYWPAGMPEETSSSLPEEHRRLSSGDTSSEPRHDAPPLLAGKEAVPDMPEASAGESPSDGTAHTDSAPAVAEAAPAVPQKQEPATGTPPAAVAESTVPPSSGKDKPAVPVLRTATPSREHLPFSRENSPFTLQKLGDGNGPTLLIIGGIQGDEPGGFSAAALIASHYAITQGSVWVVPDLNFAGILERNRGGSGDMNRKFAFVDPKDPDYDAVVAIKDILLNEQVSLILNLHDGSGFYRPTWEDALHNPKRWGQSVIIDQAEMQAPHFSKLHDIAEEVRGHVNGALLAPGHVYHTHNTLTADGNKEMAKTLSYFAVCNGKPAFGIEASKEFTTEFRSYYHLQVIEAFMQHMGIRFQRDFSLSPQGVRAALNSDLMLAAYDQRLVLKLDDARPTLNRIPFKKGSKPNDVRTSKPLLALVPDKGAATWRVAYGNRTLTRVTPEYMDFDASLENVTIQIDGSAATVPLGSVVTVRDSFLIDIDPAYRVNAIGAQKEVNGTEAGVRLTLNDFIPRFSVDKNASLYRVEVYKGKAFAGMVLVRFGDDTPFAAEESLTATHGEESALGF